MNRLAQERSPYLLQHAANPVEWFAWGDEAFAKAKTEDKPIFLSIGYSTCHWCHVMEHESFENDAVAHVLNEHFVSIKVDREERPDVDRVYMTFVQATTGSGGWPMSVWLTPDLKPFYGGTYFPPTSRWGRPGFVDILQEIARVWSAERGKVQQSAEHLTTQLRGAGRTSPDADGAGVLQRASREAALQRTVAQFRQSFDRRYGGFGDAPKFPRPSELLFLLREFARTGSSDAKDMVLAALRAMAVGGVRDHVGGGFHRYSVDAQWRVPHFEKMLYDQAQLTLAYLEGGQVSGDSFYVEVAEDTLRYVMREMTDEAGGFYSAEDADSIPPENAEISEFRVQISDSKSAAAAGKARKMEGAFYLWRADEIDRLLGDAAPIVKRRLGVEPDGNALTDPQNEFTGKNIPYIAADIEELTAVSGKPAAEIIELLRSARLKMFEHRVVRPRPHRDDKVLTAWNGLMIAAFARGARVIAAMGAGREAGRPYLETARRAASFIRNRMWSEESKTLLRRYRDGYAEIEGYAEDYAFLIFGLLELFQADPDPEWLTWAVTLQRRQDELFWDEADGGWFSTTGRDPSVLLRMKEDYDGAEPTASSVSVMNLLQLSHLLQGSPTTRWADKIDRTFTFFGTRLEQIGRAVPMMAAALSAFAAGLQQIVIVGDGAGDAMANHTVRRYLPFALVLHLTSERQAAIASVVPLIGSMRSVNDQPTAYICRAFVCHEPVTTVEDLDATLKSELNAKS